MDYNFINERIAVGAGIYTKSDLDILIAVGITHILDMRAEFDDTALNNPAVTVLWLPQEDDGTPRPPGQYRKGIEFAFTALAEANHKCYAHCAAGINRGPTMAYALLRAFGYTQPDAITAIRTARPTVGFYNVANYLLSVERDLITP